MLDDTLPSFTFGELIFYDSLVCTKEKFARFNKFPFRVFDRYEIRIHFFVDFTNGTLSFSEPHLQQYILRKVRYPKQKLQKIQTTKHAHGT